MKKILSILACFLLLFLAACSNNSPKGLVSTYCQSLKNMDFAGASKLTTNGKDFTTKSYSSDLVNRSLDCARKCCKKMNFNITNESINGNYAYITVEFDYVDVTDAVNDAFQKMYRKAEHMSNNASITPLMNDFVSDFENYLEKDSSKRSQTSIVFECTKLGKTWQISNFDSERLAHVLSGNLATAINNVVSSYK